MATPRKLIPTPAQPTDPSLSLRNAAAHGEVKAVMVAMSKLAVPAGTVSCP
jgi:hypothetical protein